MYELSSCILVNLSAIVVVCVCVGGGGGACMCMFQLCCFSRQSIVILCPLNISKVNKNKLDRWGPSCLSVCMYFSAPLCDSLN